MFWVEALRVEWTNRCAARIAHHSTDSTHQFAIAKAFISILFCFVSIAVSFSKDKFIMNHDVSTINLQ